MNLRIRRIGILSQAWLAAPATHWRQFIETRPWAMAWIYGFTVALFLGGIFLAVWHQPDLVHHINWWPFAVVTVVGVPISLLLNASRFHISCSVIGLRRSFSSSLRVTIASTAANLLPVPGGVAVRLGALKERTSGYSQAISITVATSVLWVFSVLTVGGIALLWQAVHWGAAALVIGLAGIAVAAVLITYAGGGLRHITLLLPLQALMLAVESTRIWLCLEAMGVDALWSSAAFLTVASVAGSLAGIAPGGFGIREVLAALLAPVVSLEPEAALLGTAINRLAGMAGLAALLTLDALVRTGKSSTGK